MSDQVLDHLKKLGIDFKLHEHEAFFTVAEADAFHKGMEGGFSKNLFLRNKKGDQHYLYILESHKRAELKALAKKIGESKLSLASPERLMKWLKLTPGSVGPFGLLNDQEKHVKLLLDTDLLKHNTLYYHPNRNTATLEISKEGFLRVLESLGCQLTWV